MHLQEEQTDYFEVSDNPNYERWYPANVNGKLVEFKFNDGMDTLPESEEIFISYELENDITEGVLEYFTFNGAITIPNFGNWRSINVAI